MRERLVPFRFFTSFFVFGGLLAASSVHAELAARWALDEASGWTAFDPISGYQANLEAGAVFAPGEGIRGGAVRLDKSTNGRVDPGDIFSFTGLTEFSLQVWVKTTSTDGALLFGRHVSTVPGGYWIGLNDTGDGSPVEEAGSFHFYQSDNPQLNSGDVGLDDGEWHQVVAVRDATAMEIRLYADGVRVPGPDSTGSLLPLVETPAPLLIGGMMVGGLVQGTYTGLVDEARIWDHALDDFEVASYFQHPDSVRAVLCGDAREDRTLTAADALFVLKSSVGSETCEACVCDADDSGAVAAADALRVLRRAVGQDVEMTCPSCVHVTLR